MKHFMTNSSLKKLNNIFAIAIVAIAFLSCNEDTGVIGSSLTDEADKLALSTGIYQATTKSILADSIYARNYNCYFGRVKDPETGTYVTSEFMAQFNMLENYTLPDKETITSKSEDGDIAADSCEIWLYFDKNLCYGDTLTPIKMRMLELDRPMNDTMAYYSNYDPIKEGYIREGGLKHDLAFSLSNLTYSDSIRNTSGYIDIARIPLYHTYTDKNGKTYNNYGTYILRSFYESPQYFKNSYAFIHNMCPGFFFQFNDGLGVMAKLSNIEMRIYYQYEKDTTVYHTTMRMASTQEVLQTTKVTNDKAGLQNLIANENCTYLKTPAGIFTEITLPVDDIMSTEHNTDSLLSVSLTLKQINSAIPQNKYLLEEPTSVLMVMKDSLYSFFEEEKTYDYRSTFIASLSSNCYSFSNIGNLISLMYQNKYIGELIDPEWCDKHPNWNKVVIVPIASTSSTSTTSSSVAYSLNNEMGLSSTQLVGGPNSPIEVKVIYAKFKDR